MEVLSSRILRPPDVERSLRFYEETLGLAVYRDDLALVDADELCQSAHTACKRPLELRRPAPEYGDGITVIRSA